MQKIVILDFLTAEVVIRNYPEDLDNAEDWFDSKYNDLELREANCQWMVVDDLIINSK